MTETEAREIAAPDSWPWPMSQEAQRWVEKAAKAYNIPVHQIGIAEQFNRAEHERFMRGLG